MTVDWRLLTGEVRQTFRVSRTWSLQQFQMVKPERSFVCGSITAARSSNPHSTAACQHRARAVNDAALHVHGVLITARNADGDIGELLRVGNRADIAAAHNLAKIVKGGDLNLAGRIGIVIEILRRHINRAKARLLRGG